MGSSPATPRLVTREGFLAFGTSEHYDRTSKSGIPDQWKRFGPYIGHVPGQVPDVSYGIVSNTDEAGNMDYMCAVEVPAFPAEPAEFTRLRLVPQTYAVFEHRDHIASIESTFEHIFGRGLADAGLKPNGAPVFERYDGRFDPATGLGGFEIWVPVR